MLYYEATKRDGPVSVLCDNPALQAAVFGHAGPVDRHMALAVGAQPVAPAVSYAMVQRRRVTGAVGDPASAHAWLVEHHLTHPTARRCASCAHRLNPPASPPCSGCVRPTGQHAGWVPGF